MHEMNVEQEWSSKQTRKICNGGAKLSQMRSMQSVTSKKGRKPRASKCIHVGKARERNDRHEYPNKQEKKT